MKQAFTWLDRPRVVYVLHDSRQAGVPSRKPDEKASRAGFETPENTRRPAWRTIPRAERARLTTATAIALLRANPSAIERPILEAASMLPVGFDPEAFARGARSLTVRAQRPSAPRGAVVEWGGVNYIEAVTI
jgi:arsenate reductase